jgi:hypothetical protein
VVRENRIVIGTTDVLALLLCRLATGISTCSMNSRQGETRARTGTPARSFRGFSRRHSSIFKLNSRFHPSESSDFLERDRAGRMRGGWQCIVSTFATKSIIDSTRTRKVHELRTDRIPHPLSSLPLPHSCSPAASRARRGAPAVARSEL